MVPVARPESEGEIIKMDRSKLPANVCVADDVKLGENVRLAPFVNLYGCEVGDETRHRRVRRSADAGQHRAALQNLQPYLHLLRA